MDIYTIDFETYYDREYSLSKITTEMYIRDDRFEAILVGIKKNNGPVKWIPKPMIAGFLKAIDFSKAAILCHNTAFDGAILSWHYGVRPKLWLDTLSMARPLHNVSVGGSLKALAQYYKLGAKGDEVINALGKRYEDFSKEELHRYAAYCVNDVELTYQLWLKMKREFPAQELLVIDQTLRMYTEPKLELDRSLLLQHLTEVRSSKEKLLELVAEAMGMGEKFDVQALKPVLMSNNNFALLLERLGVELPTKVSAKTGKAAYAFSKTDKAFTDLLEHPDERVRAAVEARLGVKSTLEETRTLAFIGIGERGPLPIMLNYYGAHTGRFSGGDKVNLQNLPSRGNTTIRRALKAPEGYEIIACDSSQIEARTVAWLAGQDDLVQSFREGRDVYSEFASDVYNRTVTKADYKERFVGKTCVAEGTLVLTDSGWKPIEKVSVADQVWDGVQWVWHHGVVCNGIKKTLSLCGAWLTPDHQVLCETQWLEAQSVVADEDTLFQVLDTGAESLPFQATLLAPEAVSKHSSSDVTATQQNTLWTTITSKISRVLAALSAPQKQHLRSAIGCTAKQWQMMGTGLAYSIASLRQSLGATPQPVGSILTTDSGVSLCIKSGEITGLRSSDTSRHSKVGTTLISKWIASMWTGIMNRGISASYREAITSATNGRSLTSKPVYDILNSGSRNRFTILTEAGPVIVHNCILGLGYGMGADKFRRTLALAKIDIDEVEAERIVRLYRQKYHKIVQLWQLCGNALTMMVNGRGGMINGKIEYDNTGILLPNQLKITYPALRQNGSGFEYINDARTYRKFLKDRVLGNKCDDLPWVKIYGGKVTENIVQALAGIIVREQMVKIGLSGYFVAFQVHDENVCVVPADGAEQAEEHIIKLMSQPPAWAPDLPVACESGRALNYGDC